ncbi:unnamed protein product [Auanema sp. JU1783]|nr:unnamed protein product [Auanema sp. JU1783]
MHRWLFLAALLLVKQGSAFQNDTDQGIFKVFRVSPTSETHLKHLIHIFETAPSEKADFWHAPSQVNGTVDVMISPEYTFDFEQFLLEHQFPYHIAIEDLRKMLIEKESIIEKHLDDDSLQDIELKEQTVKRFLRLHDDAGTGFMSKIKMGEYYSYHTICQWMQRIAEKLPEIATVVDIGKTVEGRRILGLKFGKERPDKKAIILDAGIHAREWTAVHTSMYIINTIVNQRTSNAQVSSYLNDLIIYVFPVLNPDGYEFTRTDTTNPRARMWRKSRSPARCAFDGISNACCQGVDLNRNFGFRFGEIGASKYPCSEIYHGPSAFSEPETIAISEFMLSQKERLQAYITLHAYSQLWIYSYSHRKFTYAPDIAETRRVAAKAVEALGKLYGTKYRHGTGPEIIYAFSGGSTDWAKETLKTKYSYTIEVRPTYEEWNGFVLEKNQLIPTAKETWAGIQVVIDEVQKQFRDGIVSEQKLNRIRQERCADRLAGCQSWLKASPNLCTAAPQSMVRDCAKSCNLCHKIAVA